MEHRGNPLPEEKVRQIRRLRREGLSIRAIQRASGASKWVVEKYCKGLPVPAQRKATAPGAFLGEEDAERFVAESEPVVDGEDVFDEPAGGDLDLLLDAHDADAETGDDWPTATDRGVTG